MFDICGTSLENKEFYWGGHYIRVWLLSVIRLSRGTQTILVVVIGKQRSMRFGKLTELVR